MVNLFYALKQPLSALGKTAAFFLPILEHLLFHLTHTRVTRILILTPTRELVAMQVPIVFSLVQPPLFNAEDACYYLVCRFIQ